MVLKKRIYDGGFHGLLPPVIPKAPRSLRRRLHNTSFEDGGISSFELLAAVADKLLQEQESESSTSSTGSKGKEQIGVHEEGVKHESFEVNVKAVIPDHHDLASGAESELVAQPTNLDTSLKESPHSENDSGSDHASIVTNSGFVKKVNTSLIMKAIEDKSGYVYDVNVVDNRAEIHPKAVEKQSGGLTSVKTYNLKDGLKPCLRTGVSNKSYASADLPFYKDHVPSACFPRDRRNVNISIRDDDEKYFRCNNRNNNRLRAFGSRSRAGYRRMRKMMPSRYWKVVRKLNEYELQNGTSGGVKSFYHKRKKICMRERFQADTAIKRRKLFHNSSKNSYVKEASSESMSNLVKFSIKSFKVPELYVEVPETETVGSLKKSVMEAVKAILHGKLHVGVVVQGKKVRDDNRTLQQSGISQNCNLETVGFTLESSLPEVPPFLAREETPSCNLQQQWVSRPIIDGCFSSSYSDPPPLATSLDNPLEKNEESTTFAAEVTEVTTQEVVEDSKALVVVPPLNTEVLSVVPLSEKSAKRYEFSQRRTRRPFSVSEVEALVEAVETLGAGRWRDVKMRAFGEANHRTYVDLKDKWKTLVHTASISPQQRRGEPVPQNLLDRVLVAHAYWSQHQAKQPVKNQKPLEAQM